MNANKICLNVSKTELDLFRSARKQLDFGLKLKLNGKRATSPRAIPLVLALLCGNCPLTLTYLFIYFQQVIVSLSIFCCEYFLVVVVRNRFYLLSYLLIHYTFLYMYCLVYSIILTLYLYTDSTSYFTLALFPPYCLHHSELFKIDVH